MTGFLATAGAIGSVFAIGACGYLARRREVLSHHGLTELSRLLIDFLLPASLFYSTYTQFDPGRLSEVVQPVLGQTFLFLAGAFLMILATQILRIRKPLGTLVSLAAFQNNVYLPLPLATALLTGQDAVRAQFYIGCFVLIFTPILWSIGVLLLTAGRSYRGFAAWRLALNPPFVAALVGILVKAIGLQVGIALPRPVIHFLSLMGNGTVPVAMIVLGGLLAEVRSIGEIDKRALLGVVLVKMFLMPACVLGFLLWWSDGDPIFRLVAMVMGAAPPATNISLIVRRFGGDAHFVAATTFLTYLLCVLTIPFWLGVFSTLGG